MTTLANLELIYNQFMNLSDEIKNSVENEEFDEALEKSVDRDKLLKKLMNARKTVEIDEDNKSKLEEMDKSLMEKDRENFVFLSKVHKELGDKLKTANKQVKINTAYSIPQESESGMYLNVEE